MNNEIRFPELKDLVHFRRHKFTLYTGKRFEDMVESVRNNGVLVPIIVRPIDTFFRGNPGEKYEILSGHNRVEAARAAGLDAVPAVIRTDLSDEDAEFIVTETNLIQRSFADLSHSERAAVISAHHSAIKAQGKRSDLLKEIDELLTPDAPENKLKSRDKIAKHYGLERNTIARYLRVSMLIPALSALLDNGKMPLHGAVALSHLSISEQEIVAHVLDGGKISMVKAEALHKLSKKGELNERQIREVLDDIGKFYMREPLTLSNRFLGGYFEESASESEIMETLKKALDKHFGM